MHFSQKQQQYTTTNNNRPTITADWLFSLLSFLLSTLLRWGNPSAFKWRKAVCNQLDEADLHAIWVAKWTAEGRVAIAIVAAPLLYYERAFLLHLAAHNFAPTRRWWASKTVLLFSLLLQLLFALAALKAIVNCEMCLQHNKNESFGARVQHAFCCCYCCGCFEPRKGKNIHANMQRIVHLIYFLHFTFFESWLVCFLAAGYQYWDASLLRFVTAVFQAAKASPHWCFKLREVGKLNRLQK